MQKIIFDFDTRQYHLAHGHEPKGYGTWAFRFEGYHEVWAPNGTYGQAKAWIKQHIKQIAPADYQGCVDVEVLT